MHLLSFRHSRLSRGFDGQSFDSSIRPPLWSRVADGDGLLLVSEHLRVELEQCQEFASSVDSNSAARPSLELAMRPVTLRLFSGSSVLVSLGRDGEGVDSVGLYSLANGFFFFRNANAPGPDDLVFGFGAGGTGISPLVGD